MFFISSFQRGEVPCWYSSIILWERVVAASGRQEPYQIFCLLWRNFIEKCILSIFHQTPCCYLFYQRSCEVKMLSCPGLCFSIFPSLERCFGETFDVGFPAWPQARRNRGPGESEHGAGMPHSSYQDWIRMFHSCKWYFFWVNIPGFLWCVTNGVLNSQGWFKTQKVHVLQIHHVPNTN